MLTTTALAEVVKPREQIVHMPVLQVIQVVIFVNEVAQGRASDRVGEVVQAFPLEYIAERIAEQIVGEVVPLIQEHIGEVVLDFLSTGASETTHNGAEGRRSHAARRGTNCGNHAIISSWSSSTQWARMSSIARGGPDHSQESHQGVHRRGGPVHLARASYILSVRGGHRQDRELLSITARMAPRSKLQTGMRRISSRTRPGWSDPLCEHGPTRAKFSPSKGICLTDRSCLCCFLFLWWKFFYIFSSSCRSNVNGTAACLKFAFSADIYYVRQNDDIHENISDFFDFVAHPLHENVSELFLFRSTSIT